MYPRVDLLHLLRSSTVIRTEILIIPEIYIFCILMNLFGKKLINTKNRILYEASKFYMIERLLLK